jgi:hypothetical protein
MSGYPPGGSVQGVAPGRSLREVIDREVRMDETIRAPIIALFEQERAADNALSRLHSLGVVRDQIKVVDQPADAVIKEPTAIDTVGATLSGEPRLDYNPIVLEGMIAGAGEHTPVINLEADLSALGVPADGVAYFLNGVRRGGTLVIITPGADTAADVFASMVEAGAAKVTHG